MMKIKFLWVFVAIALQARSTGAHGSHHHHSSHHHDDENENHDESRPGLRFMQQQQQGKYGSQGQYDNFQDYVKSIDFQTNGARCGTNDLDGEKMEESQQVFKDWLEEHQCNNTHCPFVDSLAIGRQTAIEIPVVWHDIRRSDGTAGVTSTKITDSIDVLNAAYSAAGFSFVLSSTTTTNSDAFWGALLSTPEETQMKQALRMGDCSVLNVYSNGQATYLGWAAFPVDCASDATDDGVVINYNTVPGGTFYPYNLGDTLTHEVGHWLGLFHTFQGGCAAPGDGVSDTPAEARPDYNCEVGRDTCSSAGLDPVTNYMDYGDDCCISEFTTGQIARMHSQTMAYRPTVRRSTIVTAPTPALARSSALNRTLQAACDANPPGPAPAPRPPPAPVSPPCTGCFSAMATVSIKGSGRTQMSKLEVGDEILTANGYQMVYGLAHMNDDKIMASVDAKFLRIHTKEHPRQPLEVTGEHLLFIFGEPHPVRADSITLGVRLVDYEQLHQHGALVTKIEPIPTGGYMNGLYAPLTQDGTVIVDGIVASCYISLQATAPMFVEFTGRIETVLSQHTLSHIALAPVRMVCLGISHKFCKSYNKQGVAHFVQFYFALAELLDRQKSVLVQAVLLLLFMMVFYPVYFIERLLGPAISLYVLIGYLLVFGLLSTRCQKPSIRRTKRKIQ